MVAVEVAVREVAALPDSSSSSWAALLPALRACDGFWLLESALVSERLGRFSFAGAGPRAVVRMRGGRVAIETRRASPGAPALPRRLRTDPIDALRALVPRASGGADPDAPPFAGGAVGFLGYEAGVTLEGVAPGGIDDLALPDACWLLVDAALAHETASGRLFASALGFGDDTPVARLRAERAAEALASRVARGDPDPFAAGPRRRGPVRPAPTSIEPVRLRDPVSGLALGAFFDEGSYAKAVGRIREHIAAGDVYQANLTHRLRVDLDADPWRVFGALARRNPAPFAAYLETDEITVVGASPERFLRVGPDGRVESRPIKGTRPRGATADEDARLRDVLAASEKDRAENVMIVDLVRNDLGRVCATGSVEVPELFAIEPYATVYQMVSTVRGRLAPGCDALDAVRAAFPPGSMTGAPRIAALEVLARLEPVRRGVYSGALGYLDARGGAELAVVIRTLLCRPGCTWLHVGGGITLDSDPAQEWAETLAKARAGLDALAAQR